MTVQETLASFFRNTDSSGCWAVVRINGGEIKTWSRSKRAAQRAIDRQWEPSEWTLVRKTAA